MNAERALGTSDVPSSLVVPTSFEDPHRVAAIPAVDAADDTFEGWEEFPTPSSWADSALSPEAAAAFLTETPTLGVDDVRQIVRDELERWAVDVLPILIRQELRRARHDRNG